jgi:hypothetical protein
LSYRAAAKQIERKEIEQYRSTSKTSSTATIGDALKSVVGPLSSPGKLARQAP